MNKIFETYKPEGFHTINTYLLIDNPQELIDFLRNAFWAEEIDRSINPQNGDISNCILKIGDSCFMLSQAREPFLNMKTSLYLFVDNVEEVHQRSMENGAILVFEPADMPYGDRQSGVIDPSGNYWWISKRMEEKNY